MYVQLLRMHLFDLCNLYYSSMKEDSGMKEFLSYLKPYKRDAVLAVFCIEAETVF